MKDEKYHRFINWGVTAVIVLALMVFLTFSVIRIDKVTGALRALNDILAPISCGAVMAYLFAPVYNRVSAAVMANTKKLIPDEKKREKIAGACGTILSVALLIGVIVGFISMIVPQVINSIIGIAEALPTSIRNLELWLERIFADNPEVEAVVMQYYTQGMEYIQNRVYEDLLPNLSAIVSGTSGGSAGEAAKAVSMFANIVSSVSSGVVSVINMVMNLLIGVIVMVYLLNMKKKLLTQVKMIIYSVFSLKNANKVIEEFRFVHSVFGGFIIGKLLDSLIIGIMSFVLLGFMKMPYVLLVSVIIGVTNVIPFFGPFIGAVPSAILILLVSPMKCLYFIGFIFLLQQFDGNILGPKILGDSTGLSSFWVLFSILLFGGVFGFVGMIIGVPTFAVIYRMTTELVTSSLKKKRLATDLAAYDQLDYIDEKNKTYIKK